MLKATYQLICSAFDVKALNVIHTVELQKTVEKNLRLFPVIHYQIKWHMKRDLNMSFPASKSYEIIKTYDPCSCMQYLISTRSTYNIAN